MQFEVFFGGTGLFVCLVFLFCGVFFWLVWFFGFFASLYTSPIYSLPNFSVVLVSLA